MTVERLEWSLMEAQELLDSLPALSPNPSQDTRDRIYAVNELFGELFDKATTKGYVQPRRQQSPDDPVDRSPSPQVCLDFRFLTGIDSHIVA